VVHLEILIVRDPSAALARFYRRGKLRADPSTIRTLSWRVGTTLGLGRRLLEACAASGVGSSSGEREFGIISGRGPSGTIKGATIVQGF
jgi:hypothetical protein